MRHHSAPGFTLLEVMLVLMVSSVLLGAATLLYVQMRENAGATNARARAAALQTVVERLITQGDGGTPSADLVRAAWRESRQDALANPWGGEATCAQDSPGCASAIREVVIGCSDSNDNRCRRDNTVPGDSGVLAYIRFQNRIEDPTISTWDNSLKMYVHTSGYATAMESPSGRQFYFVTGQPARDTANGQPRSPQVDAPAECGCSFVPPIVGAIENFLK